MINTQMAPAGCLEDWRCPLQLRDVWHSALIFLSSQRLEALCISVTNLGPGTYQKSGVHVCGASEQSEFAPRTFLCQPVSQWLCDEQ